MTGSLQIKNKKYYVVLSYKDIATGKNKTKWVHTGISAQKGNKKIANEKRKEILEQYTDEILSSNPDMLFSDYISEWLSYEKFQVDSITYMGYKYTINKHIIPYFKAKNKKLKDLTSFDIELYYKSKMEEGLSAHTIKHHHANIRRCLRSAKKKGYIKENPAIDVDLPRVQQYEADTLNSDELKHLMKVIESDILEIPILMGIYYGMRRSEICGLQWSCIDFDKETITVKRVLVKEENGFTLKEKTKSKSSTREYPMLPVLKIKLKKALTDQKRNKLMYGSRYNCSDFVFTHPNGDFIKPDYLSRHYKMILNNNGIKPVRFHDLRHSCGTLLTELNVPDRLIADWLGHSSVVTTQRYTHIRNKKRNELGELLERKLS